jgi:hypothetical protein
MVSYQQLQCATNEPHSEASAVYDWEVFGIYAGNRLTEWAQRDDTDIVLNIDESPKAFIISDIEFFGKNWRRCSLHLLCSTLISFTLLQSHGASKRIAKMARKKNICSCI